MTFCGIKTQSSKATEVKKKLWIMFYDLFNLIGNKIIIQDNFWKISKIDIITY